ncbi:MAG: hypothetical protein K1X67_20485 [Fimbriimonadaceae bacterium]|nr:hypothetical protein [Fimbriimonadaceae bacterium]
MGILKKISQGGQGVVYRAPSVHTTFAKSMVYKEYKPSVLASVDVDALEAIPEFLESLPYGDGSRLINIASWPCAVVVDDAGQTTGFVMPSIPDEFFTEFWTSNKKVPSAVAAELQHLLNEPQVVAARFGGRVVSDRQKYELLREVVFALEFLHEHNVCVGDISPKNLLFSFSPSTAVYFIDCDAMRINGVSLSQQVETPGWQVPPGEDKATAHSDRYKLGLLALRLLMGSQDASDPHLLPSSTSVELRQLITNTLTTSPQQRPDLSTWREVLTQAILTAPTTAPQVPKPTPAPRPPSPPLVTITSQPTRSPSNTVPIQISQPHAVIGPPPATARPRVSSSWLLIAAIASAVLIAIVIVATNNTSIDTTRASTSPTESPDNGRDYGASSTSSAVQVPPEAVVCSQSAGGTYRVAARGNNVTTCPFAEAVREQVNRSSAGFPRTVNAYSPITKQSYDMWCVGQSLIKCTGGNDAVVYLY